MRLGPPYSVAEIMATPHDLDRPYEESRRGKMWQARIDYWTRLSYIAAACAVIFSVISVVFLVIAATR